MRLLQTLFLSLFCFAATLHSNAAALPAKQPKASHAYIVAEQAVPNDALNDYHHVTAPVQFKSSNSFQKHVSYFYGDADRDAKAYVPDDSFPHLYLFFCGNYAKSYRAKLIFPQHYYW